VRPTIYIFLNKSLHMSVGKAASQAAHATIKAVQISSDAMLKSYNESPHQTVITLGADDDKHIDHIVTYLSQRNFKCSKVVDEGITEVKPFSVTALVSEIVDKEDIITKMTFSSFKKYEDVVRFIAEVRR
jgi:peptidyl-tRNA hydrolase